MIIGNGDIASALREVDRDDLIFFASGVSNSQETRIEEFRREVSLLVSQPRDKILVYFSSLCIFYADTKYARHKKEMEEVVKNGFPEYTIIRLGNITWGNNPHTLINFVRNKIKNNEQFEVKDEYRYIIDKDEFLHWVKLIPNWNCEMNITGSRMKVADIITKYGYVDIHSK